MSSKIVDHTRQGINFVFDHPEGTIARAAEQTTDLPRRVAVIDVRGMTAERSLACCAVAALLEAQGFDVVYGETKDIF